MIEQLRSYNSHTRIQGHDVTCIWGLITFHGDARSTLQYIKQEQINIRMECNSTMDSTQWTHWRWYKTIAYVVQNKAWKAFFKHGAVNQWDVLLLFTTYIRSSNGLFNSRLVAVVKTLLKHSRSDILLLTIRVQLFEYESQSCIYNYYNANMTIAVIIIEKQKDEHWKHLTYWQSFSNTSLQTWCILSSLILDFHTWK